MPLCARSRRHAPALALTAALLCACKPPLEATDSSTGTGTGTGSSTAVESPATSTGAPTSTGEQCLDDTASFHGGTLDLGVGVECDVFDQACCGAGHKCAAWSDDDSGKWNATRCVPVTGDQSPGEPCTTEAALSGLDDCRRGALCWNADADNQGVCVALCTLGQFAVPQCGVAETCLITPALNLCLPTCDPLVQDCPGGDLCLPNGDEFACVYDASGDTGQANDPCKFQNGCDPGLYCLAPAAASSACDPDLVGCCQPFCEHPAGACPNADQQCLPWYSPGTAPPGGDDIGVCRVPD